MSTIVPNFRIVRNLDEYFNQYVIDAQRGYALMNPLGHEAKYSRRSEPLTPDLVYGALNGETRRTRAGGNWQTVPISLAIIPQTIGAKSLGKNIILDVDTGGRLALIKLLETCAQHGLSAFAQPGQSATHDGGHVSLLGSELLPAPMLREIAQRIALAAGIECETWPCNADVRLPLMIHTRAPGGPKRYPLILQTGEIITPDRDVWAAVDALRNVPVNNPETLTTALGTLPLLPIGGGNRQPTHRSKINPEHGESVIHWFNDRHDLAGLLERAGAEFKSQYASVIRCPYHDDQSPSLAIFRTDEGKTVCKCFSRSSGCPLADGPYYDSFDLYKLATGLGTVDAVRRLVAEHKIGQKTQTVIERVQPEPPPDEMPRLMHQHKRALNRARKSLRDILVDAGTRTGEGTVIRATPGLGKTHIAAALANTALEKGQQVAIVAPTLDIAENEWLPRLQNGYIWRSKLDLCTCHDRALLQKCVEFGYKYPDCTNSDCPYHKQVEDARGKQIVFQHNHLFLRDGAQLLGADLIIVDESPLAALTPERHVSISQLEGFAKKHPTDPAANLCSAIARAMRSLPETMTDTRGLALESAINRELGHSVEYELRSARKSKFNTVAPQPPQEISHMTRQFLGGLVRALDAGLDRVSYGRLSGSAQWALVWHDRQLVALTAKNSLKQPAVIVLDGSANQMIYDAILSPWPVRMVDIACDLSPQVEIVQVRCTPSTRHVVKDDRALTRLARQVAHVCNELGVTLAGGVTFEGAKNTLANALGGQWLHYGGQRGQNVLQGAGAIAVVCSPTIPPAAVERRALALWPHVGCEWVKSGRAGEYVASDARLQALALTHSMEELRQAVYRVRPLSAEKPTRLLVFTPWDLNLIGLTPGTTIDEITDGQSNRVTRAIDAYHARVFSDQSSLQRAGDFQHGINIENEHPVLKNGKRLQLPQLPKHDRASPPLSAKTESPRLDEPPAWLLDAPPVCVFEGATL